MDELPEPDDELSELLELASAITPARTRIARIAPTAIAYVRFVESGIGDSITDDPGWAEPGNGRESGSPAAPSAALGVEKAEGGTGGAGERRLRPHAVQ